MINLLLLTFGLFNFSAANSQDGPIEVLGQHHDVSFEFFADIIKYGTLVDSIMMESSTADTFEALVKYRYNEERYEITIRGIEPSAVEIDHEKFSVEMISLTKNNFYYKETILDDQHPIIDMVYKHTLPFLRGMHAWQEGENNYLSEAFSRQLISRLYHGSQISVRMIEASLKSGNPLAVHLTLGHLPIVVYPTKGFHWESSGSHSDLLSEANVTVDGTSLQAQLNDDQLDIFNSWFATQWNQHGDPEVVFVKTRGDKNHLNNVHRIFENMLEILENQILVNATEDKGLLRLDYFSRSSEKRSEIIVRLNEDDKIAAINFSTLGRSFSSDSMRYLFKNRTFSLFYRKLSKKVLSLPRDISVDAAIFNLIANSSIAVPEDSIVTAKSREVLADTNAKVGIQYVTIGVANFGTIRIGRFFKEGEKKLLTNTMPFEISMDNFPARKSEIFKYGSRTSEHPFFIELFRRLYAEVVSSSTKNQISAKEIVKEEISRMVRFQESTCESALN